MASIVDFPAGPNASPGEMLRLMEVFLRIADPVTRQRILAIVEALADDSDRAASTGGVRPSTTQAGEAILAVCRRVLER